LMRERRVSSRSAASQASVRALGTCRCGRPKFGVQEVVEARAQTLTSAHIREIAENRGAALGSKRWQTRRGKNASRTLSATILTPNYTSTSDPCDGPGYMAGHRRGAG
jgi:hypothetical protein